MARRDRRTEPRRDGVRYLIRLFSRNLPGQRRLVSMAILTEMKDPRVRDVTVTYVEVAPDMRSAKVHVSIMGNETKQNLSLRGLQNAAGFLQHQLSEKIDTRYTPRLTFKLDGGVKKSIEIARLLKEVLPPDPPMDAAPEEAEAWNNLGFCYHNLGQTEGALQAVEKALAIRPDFAQAQTNLEIIRKESQTPSPP